MTSGLIWWGGGVKYWKVSYVDASSDDRYGWRWVKNSLELPNFFGGELKVPQIIWLGSVKSAQNCNFVCLCVCACGEGDEFKKVLPDYWIWVELKDPGIVICFHEDRVERVGPSRILERNKKKKKKRKKATPKSLFVCFVRSKCVVIRKRKIR